MTTYRFTRKPVVTRVTTKGGKRPDLGNRYFRSMWEANYARYLNWMKGLGEVLSWGYETFEFSFPVKRGTRFYKPDFEITWRDGLHEHVEIKGWMDGKSKTQIARMARYYPHVKVRVVGPKEYLHLAKQVSKLVTNWEVGG